AQQRPVTVILHFLAMDDRRGSDLFQILFLICLARSCGHFIPKLRQNADGHCTYAARGTGDQNESAVGVYLVVAQVRTTNGGGRSGRARRHTLTQLQSSRQGHTPVAGKADVLPKAATGILAEVVAGNNYASSRAKPVIAAL